MRNLIVTLAACAASAAMATERPKPMPHGGNSAADAAATASATSSSTLSAVGGSVGAIDVSLMNNPVSGDVTMRSGNVYSLAAPAMAAPLPPGLCPRNHSTSVAPLGGLLFSYSESSTGTDYDCLKMVLAHLREVAEIGARPAVVNYISHYVSPEPEKAAKCAKPAPAKKKPAAKKPVQRCEPK